MNLGSLYRRATGEEINFYHQKLYPLQDQVFKIAANYGQEIYLTGGTALARFSFQHRFSDDLDFFTTTDNLQIIANDLASQLLKHNLEVEISQINSYFARIFVNQNEVNLKIDFAREFNHYGNLIRTNQGIYVNNLEDQGGNKISAFEDRANIKDVIDLYYLTKILSFERLFEIAELKRIPIAYEHLLTFNTQAILGNALVIEELNPIILSDFLEELKSKTQAEIKKKEELAIKNITGIIAKILWDFPKERRILSEYSQPVLTQRLETLPLPEKMALAKILTIESETLPLPTIL
jgi:predicted nucleotidyltransferase component of viral defense system